MYPPAPHSEHIMVVEKFLRRPRRDIKIHCWCVPAAAMGKTIRKIAASQKNQKCSCFNLASNCVTNKWQSPWFHCSTHTDILSNYAQRSVCSATATINNHHCSLLDVHMQCCTTNCQSPKANTSQHICFACLCAILRNAKTAL